MFTDTYIFQKQRINVYGIQNEKVLIDLRILWVVNCNRCLKTIGKMFHKLQNSRAKEPRGLLKRTIR